MFSDDLALDVRGAWRDALLAGVDADAATRQVAGALRVGRLARERLRRLGIDVPEL